MGTAKVPGPFPGSYLDRVRDLPPGYDVLFFVATALAGGLLFAISGALHPAVSGWPAGASLTGTFLMTVTVAGLFVGNGLFLLLVASLISYFFVSFVEPGPDFEKTLKTVVYASAVPLLLAWAVWHLPAPSYSAGITAAAFSLSMFYGARAFQRLSADRAFFVALSTSLVILTLLYLADALPFAGP